MHSIFCEAPVFLRAAFTDFLSGWFFLLTADRAGAMLPTENMLRPLAGRRETSHHGKRLSDGARYDVYVHVHWHDDADVHAFPCPKLPPPTACHAETGGLLKASFRSAIPREARDGASRFLFSASSEMEGSA